MHFWKKWYKWKRSLWFQCYEWQAYFCWKYHIVNPLLHASDLGLVAHSGSDSMVWWLGVIARCHSQMSQPGVTFYRTVGCHKGFPRGHGFYMGRGQGVAKVSGLGKVFTSCSWELNGLPWAIKNDVLTSENLNWLVLYHPIYNVTVQCTGKVGGT